MKKLIILLSLIALLFNMWVSFAQKEDNQIGDMLNDIKNDQDLKNVKTLNESFKFKTFNSCKDFNSVVWDYFKKYYKWSYSRWWGILYNMLWDSMSVKSEVAVESSIPDTQWAVDSDESMNSNSTDFSQTNIQVKWVDEPEIIKTDGKYIYYYNQKLSKIYIISSPLDISTSKINLDKVNIIKQINVPQNLTNIKMFLYTNKLTIIWDRYATNYDYESIVDNNSKTVVIVYDISDLSKLKLVKLYEAKWNYLDARMIKNELYLISNVYLRPYYAFYKKWIEVVDPKISSYDILPSSIELSYTNDKSDQNLKIKWKTYPYNLDIEKIDCNDVFYLLPSEDTMSKYNPQTSMAILSKIDIDNYSDNIETKTLFGDVSQIHMTEKSLYLTNNFYISYDFGCPIWAYCIMPYFRQWENSLIHKFDLEWTWNNALNYNNSVIIPWLPLNQYSMSEDDDWYFRILTKKWYPQLNTNLFILDSQLKLYSKLTDIEIWEEFKSSRFMWDKLYLVTFKQIDPLFVIDLKDKLNPKILWELKIPWYSTYLHPYADMENGIQYLIWLWYDTADNQWWWTTNAWLKIDLYKIDYNKVWNISVEQLYTKTVWSKWSWSEALENPRMFVWNNKSKLLLMPTILQTEEQSQSCTIQYDPSWKEVSKNCYPISTYKTDFAGIKWFNIDKDKWITETISNDYKDKIINEQNKQYYGQWNFRELNFRVGYLWDVIYSINTDFANFNLLNNNKIIKTIDFWK
jgi:inhibitor of cysteine peptidase